MRIAVLTNVFYPQQTGGAARMAAVQVEGLKAAGHEVKVFCPNIPWLKYPALARLFFHLTDLFPRSLLLDEIMAWKPEVLITHNLTGCGFATPAAVQKIGSRWVHVLHDGQLFEPSGRLVSSGYTLWQRFWGSLRRVALGKPEAVISPTRWLLDEHCNRGFFKRVSCSVIPNPGPMVTASRQGPCHDPVRLVFVGGVSEEKGALHLISLMKTLSFSYELHVIGEGPALERMREALPQARFYGRKDADEILNIFFEMDVLLVPSQIAENQPTVILEAASVGLPVIASCIGGIPETLGTNELICDPRDVSAWAEAISHLATDSGYYQRVAEVMRKLAHRHEPSIYFTALLEVLTSNLKTVTVPSPKL